MKVVVNSDQIRRIGYNVLDSIYGPLKKNRGLVIKYVYSDKEQNPRIGIHDSIFYPTVVFILKKDFLKFKSIIPLDELDFAEVFKGWLERNYDVSGFEKLTTIGPEKMTFVPEYTYRR
jgi:hypothetical protein